jgi:hypothetical protein
MGSDGLKLDLEEDSLGPVVIKFGCWDTLKSRLIRWLTKSKWSHVWIEYYSKRWQRPMVVHSDKKGVIIEPSLNFYMRRDPPVESIEYKLHSQQCNLSAGFYDSANYLGKDYGYIALILNSIILILWRMGWKSLKGVRDIGKYTCSEFVTLFIKNCNIRCELDAEYTWPGKLEEWIKTRENYFRKVNL